ncbi:MAG: uracil-xanthine permease family protein [Candidatus Merdivicinus sp.]|jgi:uracil permease
MKKTKTAPIGREGLFDAKSLGIPKMLLLGLQHTFAMFGATVLVPIITGLDVSTTLLVAGLGTLLFHFLTKGKVPAFLGSSFAFLGGFAAVAPRLEDGSANLEMLPYACGGVAVAGLVYVVLSLLISAFGVKRVMRFFPPIVTGPIIIAIGLILAPSAVTNASTNWLLALVALVVIIVCNIWGKGMIKIIPIILGIVVSYIVALCMNAVDFTAIQEAKWIGIPVHTSALAKFDLNAILMIVPIALATIMEHIGDMAAISATTGRNYIADPGLSKTLLGDGLATTMAGLLGGPANTTYGENTGVLAMTRIYDPRVMRIAACFAIFLSFSPKIGAVIETIPTAIIGGVSIILYGMISAVGVRNIVENRVDFTKTRNLVIAAVILVSALGINFAFENNGISFAAGHYTITLSGLAVAAILGILLNAIIPGNDYEFGKDEESEQAVSFKV